jgi:acyl-CoA synthetase (NDP forming)
MEHPLMEAFLNPRSVVLIGVSRQSGVGAYNNLEMMLRYGYGGTIHLVHPKVPEILGRRAHPRVADLPEIPELAVISVGRDRVLPVFKECAEKGIRNIIVISQGFSDADEAGAAMQEQLVALAREHTIRVLGPNTMGVLNNFSRFNTGFVDIVRDEFPPPLTMVAQSGVFQVGYESFTHRVGKAIDVGNGCDIDFVDVLEYLETDPQTRIIFIHMEGLKRGREFLRLAARVARLKPIIILKTGRSAAGAEAALSHTGSLAGEDAVIDAAFRRAGLIRVRNMIELKAACQAFLHFSTLKGSRIGVVTATGACGIMTADACEDYGLELAPFPEAIRDGLENSRIAWHKLRNPVDVWPLGMVTGSFTGVLKQAVRGLLADENVDAVLCIAPAMASPLHADLDLVAAAREINRENLLHKPIALWLYGGDQDNQSAALEGEAGVGCFGTIDEAVMGLSALLRHERYRQEPPEEGELFPPLTSSASRPVALPSGRVILGDEAGPLFKAFEVPVVPAALTNHRDAAVEFARTAGYPVVLKIVSEAWIHKSDQGGIRLDLRDDDELRRAYDELTGRFRSTTPFAALDGILVQKQARGFELLVGMKNDPQLGPVVVVGMGGIYTEVFRDVARGVAPVSLSDARKMLQSLKCYPILSGIRGQEGVDLRAIENLLVSISRLAMDYPEIREMDLNPVLAAPEGCWCVDSRLVIEPVSG